MPNVIANSPNILVSKAAASFVSAGITAANTSIIYLADTVDKVFKSYVPGRGINAISSFELNKGYVINAITNIDLSAYTLPMDVVDGGTPIVADYVLDRFIGTNGATLSGRISDTGDSWIVHSGGLEISINKIIGTPRGIGSIATVNAGVNNVTIEINFSLLNTGSRPVGIICRYVDDNNYFLVQSSATGNGFRLYEKAAGVLTLLNFAPVGNTNLMTVVCKDASITGFHGSSIVEYLGATNNQTATRFGVYMERDTNTGDVGLNQVDQIDSFIVWEGDGLKPANPQHIFSLEYPNPYQIFQRNPATNQAAIKIKGTVYSPSGPVDIQARFNGGLWVQVATGITNSFETELAGQSGQGLFELRIASDITKITAVPFVGIGDVYMVAGQSNASGFGDSLFGYTHPTLKAGMFGNDYRWKELYPPFDNPRAQKDLVSQDPAAVGAYWPLLATQMMANRNVPVAMIPCPKGATSVGEWLPGSNHFNPATLYGSMLVRAGYAMGVKAVLYHQGESDSVINGFTGGAVYKTRIKQLADAVYADLGVKLIVARIHAWGSAPSTTEANVDEINQAIFDASTENVNMLLGPDFNNPNLTVLLHFTSDAEMQDAADRWWTRLNALGI